MTRTHLKQVVWLYFVAFAAVVCVALFVHGVHRVRVKDVQDAVIRDLATGSDEPTVHRFMDSHHIVYVGYSRELHRSYGKIYRTSFVSFWKGRIFLQFNFNEQGKMDSYRAVEVYDFIWE